MPVSDWIRFCAICRRWQPCVKWLCPTCWKQMERHYLPVEDIYRHERTLPHLRLFDWHDENYFLIKLFIESLKGGGYMPIFNKMAYELFSRSIHLPWWPKQDKLVFVPAASSHKKQKDHAWFLAKALNFYYQGEFKDVLKKKDLSFQKRKSRFERSSLELLNQGILLTGQETIIFVDDVLTTGSTAKSAYKALGRPSKFFIFSLAWKRFKEEEIKN